MLKKATLVVAILAFSSVVIAQRSQEQAAANGPETTACSFVYSSGSVNTFTRYCLTVNGNIVQFDSPEGFEFINVGTVAEGYAICDFDGGPKAYVDYAFRDSGDWGATSVSAPNATTRKFVRITSDGLWQLSQTIKQIKANAKSPGSVSITMAVKNLTAIPRRMVILRYADVDANSDFADDEFDNTLNSAFGREPGPNFGLGLTNNTFTLKHNAFTQSLADPPDPCNPLSKVNAGHFVGDGSIGHFWSAFPVAPDETKTVVMTYKPI